MIDKITTAMEGNKQALFRYVLYRIGNKEDAEDLLQNVYLNLIDNSRQLFKVQDLTNYIFICTVNACNRYIRNSRNERNRLKEYQEHLEAVCEHYSINNFEDEFTYHQRLLASLPDEQVKVIQLKIYADLSFDKISQILSIPEATVKSRFYAGLSKLRNDLKTS